MAGEVTVADVLAQVPVEARSWPVFDLLIAQHRWGRTRTLKLLARCWISERRPVGGLTERERRMLAEAVTA